MLEAFITVSDNSGQLAFLYYYYIPLLYTIPIKNEYQNQKQFGLILMRS